MGRQPGVDKTGEQSNNGSGLPLAEGETAALEEKWDADASIKLRLFRAKRDIPILDKDGTNEHFNYKYPTRDMIVYHAKEVCEKHGIDWDPIQHELTRDGNMVSGWFEVVFYCVDRPEDRDFQKLFIAATDKGDKGPSKHATLGERQCLQKKLKIVTKDEGEDPDKYSVDYEPAKDISTSDAQEKAQMILGWASTMRTSILNANEAKELTNLSKDCAAFFNSEDVPDSVKDEFRKLIKDRRASLKAQAAEEFEEGYNA